MFVPLKPTANAISKGMNRVYCWDMVRCIADVETGSELSCYQLGMLTDMIIERMKH